MLDRLHRVHDFRVAQIEDGKKFQSQYDKLVRAYRRMVAAGPQRALATPQEQALLDKQQHYSFNELSVREQSQLKSEMDSMWCQIPAHLQEKAKGLAGIN